MTDHDADPSVPPLPSLDVIATQVASERGTMTSHAESLDNKAGVVLGFAGLAVGLGTTAQLSVASNLVFDAGLACGVLSAVLAALAFLPRRYPVVQVHALRELLTAPEEETKLKLLDAQIAMVTQTATLVKQKGRRVKASVVFLAAAAALIVIGSLIAVGGSLHV